MTNEQNSDMLTSYYIEKLWFFPELTILLKGLFGFELKRPNFLPQKLHLVEVKKLTSPKGSAKRVLPFHVFFGADGPYSVSNGCLYFFFYCTG